MCFGKGNWICLILLVDVISSLSWLLYDTHSLTRLKHVNLLRDNSARATSTTQCVCVCKCVQCVVTVELEPLLTILVAAVKLLSPATRKARSLCALLRSSFRLDRRELLRPNAG